MKTPLEMEPALLSARGGMPVCKELTRRFINEKPFEGHTPMINSHVTIEVAVAASALYLGGASNVVVGSTSYGTDEQIYQLFRKAGVPVFAKPKVEGGISEEECRTFIRAAFAAFPIDGVIDDGGRCAQLLKASNPQVGKSVLGVVEQTRGGENIWKELFGKVFPLPVISANESPYKKIEHRTTARTVVSASLSALKGQFAGKTVAIIGFGGVGREIALLLKQPYYDARVVVVDDDDDKLVEAINLGCGIDTKERALKKADVIITATGNLNIITTEDEFNSLKDGAILINAGRYGEINIEVLQKMASKKYTIRGEPESLTQYVIGRKSIYVVACAFPVNIYMDQGNPKEVLDLIFGLMLDCLRYIYQHEGKLKKMLLPAPKECIRNISHIFLKAHGYPPKSG